MRRRGFLGTLGAVALGGCLNRGGGGARSPSTRFSTPTPTSTPPASTTTGEGGRVNRRLAIGEEFVVDDLAVTVDEVQVASEVEFVEYDTNASTVTATHPEGGVFAFAHVTARNRGEEARTSPLYSEFSVVVDEAQYDAATHLDVGEGGPGVFHKALAGGRQWLSSKDLLADVAVEGWVAFDLGLVDVEAEALTVAWRRAPAYWAVEG